MIKNTQYHETISWINMDGTYDVEHGKHKLALMKATTFGIYTVVRNVYIFSGIGWMIHCMKPHWTDELLYLVVILFIAKDHPWIPVSIAYTVLGKSIIPNKRSFHTVLIFNIAFFYWLNHSDGMFTYFYLVYTYTIKFVQMPRSYDINICSLPFGVLWTCLSIFIATTLCVQHVDGNILPYLFFPFFDTEYDLDYTFVSFIVNICSLVKYPYLISKLK